MCNKKAVLCTAFFVISVHCFVQARQCTATTKATLMSGFLVAHCARDSGGEDDEGYLLQTFKVLYDFYRMRSHHTHS